MARNKNQDADFNRKQRRLNRINNKNNDIDIGRFFELATGDQIYINGLNLLEVENDILEDYKGDFELIGPIL